MSTNVKIVVKNLKNFSHLTLVMKMLFVPIVIHLNLKGCFQHSVHLEPVLEQLLAVEAAALPAVHFPEHSKCNEAVASNRNL